MMQRVAGTGRARPPASVLALTALLVAIMGLGELTSPVWRTDDELMHVDMVRYIADDWGWPGIDDHFLARPMWTSFAYAQRGWAVQPPLTADDAPERTTRPGFSAFGPPEDTIAVNWMAQHPPTYYWLMAGILQAANVVVPGPDVGSFMQEVSLLRWVNLLMLAPLPALAWATARRLRLAHWLSVVVAALPLALPSLTAIGPVVGNDAMLILGFSLLTWLLARVVTGDNSVRTALAVGVVGTMALLTKGFAFLVPPWVVFAYVVAWRRHGPATSWRRPAALAAGVTVVAGGSWWLRNLVVQGAVQPRSSGILPPPPPGFSPDWVWWLGQVALRIAETLWAPFRPWWALVPLLVIALVAVVVAFWVGRGRRWQWAVMLTPVCGLTVLMMVVASDGYALTGKVPGIHIRYMMGGAVGAAVVVGCGLGALAVRLGVARWLGTSVLAVALVVQAWSLRSNVATFWGTPGESTRERLDDLVAWSSWPPAVLVLTVAVTAGLAVWALSLQVKECQAAPGGPEGDDPDGSGGASRGPGRRPLASTPGVAAGADPPDVAMGTS
jgi:hypothetical protein